VPGILITDPRKALFQASLVSLALLGSGCSLFLAKETIYLQSAQDRATKQEVRQHLGKPMFVAATQTGESVWVYQVREPEKGGNDSSTFVGSWCDEYVLTFDKRGILRRWTHQSQKHRTTWPTFCVTDGFEPEKKGF
jgi:outer membrane protein assembly factor BamE (lipoprotein component of BamABCDE complex)